MNNNSKTIITLCSHLCVGDGVKPLEPSEWSKLAATLMEKRLQPQDILAFSKAEFHSKLGWDSDQIARVQRLLDRSASLTFELVDYENKGIYVITRADKEYPRRLKQKLGSQCPPLFYCAGDINLLNVKSIGYVGSRKIDADDAVFTQELVKRTVNAGYSIVSGGAKGVDSIASEISLSCGGIAIEFLGDSMLKRIRNVQIIEAVQNSRAILLSALVPDAGFFVGNLMARNKFIYAQSEATVVVRSDFKKGGTWNGATECLKKGWSQVLCRGNNESLGNKELIKLGAKSIDNTWSPTATDSNSAFFIEDEQTTNNSINQSYEQISLEGF